MTPAHLASATLRLNSRLSLDSHLNLDSRLSLDSHLSLPPLRLIHVKMATMASVRYAMENPTVLTGLYQIPTAMISYIVIRAASGIKKLVWQA